jgi:hypothetical protein
MANIKFSSVAECLISNCIPPVVQGLEYRSETFLPGDFVYSASGYIKICGSDPAVILGVARTKANAGVSDGLYKCEITPAIESVLFMMSVYHSTAGNNLIELTDLYAEYGIAKNAAGKWVVDKTDTSATRVKIIKFVDPIGTVAGLVLVKVLVANRQLAG